MLEIVRKAVKSWVAKVFLGLLVASFAVFGIGDVFTASLGSSVASVGEQKISVERFLAAFNQQTRTMSQRFGQPIDTAMARQLGLDRQVVGQLASEATLDHAMAELELSAPDEVVARTIRNDPSFGGAGDFDEASYRYAIANAGYTVESYEDEIRRTLARNQLTAALVAGAPAPAGAAETLYLYQEETRRFDYVVLNTADHGEDPGAPDEAALAAFHEENAALFSSPEARDVVFLHLDIDELAKGFEADEDELRALYDNRATLYQLPERRALYQIVFDDAAEAAAAKARIDAGEIDFDGLLAERGETRLDVSLGDLAKGELATASADAAFAAAGVGVVGPVDTGFGAALIDVAAVTPAETVPFEDARAELAIDLQRSAALDAAPGLAGEIEDMRAGGATLEEIAGELSIELGVVKGLDETGADGFPDDPEFIEEAFSAEDGEERDMIETDGGDFFVLRVDRITPTALRPLADVRAEVETAYAAAARRDALEDRIKAALERVDSGEMLALIADEAATDMETEGPLTRTGQWAAIPPQLVRDLFAKPMGGAGYAPAPGRADAFVIAQVVGIEAPEIDDVARDAIEQLNRDLGQMAGADALELYLVAKQEEAGVEVNAQLIESILSQSH